MLSKKLLEKEINELSVLQTLSRAYAEIAATRMNKSRGAVLLNRNFLGSISAIFQEIINSYRLEILELAKSKTKKGSLPTQAGKNVTFLSHNGKTVAVFLAANVGFYGDIVSKTFALFAEEVRSGDVEATIIGRLGLSMFKDAFPNTPYTYFDFPDNEIRTDLLTEIMSHLVSYEEMHVYYGQFQSVITQRPTVSKISSQVISLETAEKDKNIGSNANHDTISTRKYLFEPSLEDILKFFEGEIFTSLIDQILRESQLAKFASRITAMTKANENISSELKEMQLENLKLSHSIANKKQLNNLAAILR